ncbi:chitin binding domain-containing protein, partial [bacterium LRH843]|nr:chitin binding domain-containing protein [bacterium LRH843]
KFYNCWEGRGHVQMCAPGTLFNQVTLECDFPHNVKCPPKQSSNPVPLVNNGADNYEQDKQPRQFFNTDTQNTPISNQQHSGV